MRAVRSLLLAILVASAAMAGYAFDAGAPDPRPAAGPAATAPPPRILGVSTDPALPSDGTVLRLPAGAGDLTVRAWVEHATRVRFLLAPPAGDAGDPAVPLGADSSGRDGWTVGWRYQDRPLVGRLTVQATGPGGTVERSVAVRHPGPEGRP
jgi:hypothetical protein